MLQKGQAARIAVLRARSERPLPRKVASTAAVRDVSRRIAPRPRRQPATAASTRRSAAAGQRLGGGGGGGGSSGGGGGGGAKAKGHKRPAVRHQVRLPSSSSSSDAYGRGNGKSNGDGPAVPAATRRHAVPPKPKVNPGPTEAEVAAALQAEEALQKRREDGRRHVLMHARQHTTPGVPSCEHLISILEVPLSLSAEVGTLLSPAPRHTYT